MAKKNYRVMYGDHMIPNPEFKLGMDDPVHSHISAPKGSIITLDEERAIAFTKVLPGSPIGPKLVETSDKPQLVTSNAVAAPSDQKSEAPKAAAATR